MTDHEGSGAGTIAIDGWEGVDWAEMGRLIDEGMKTSNRLINGEGIRDRGIITEKMAEHHAVIARVVVATVLDALTRHGFTLARLSDAADGGQP